MLFYLFAAMAVVSAIGVVISRNIVRTAVCLLFTLLGVAGLYFLLCTPSFWRPCSWWSTPAAR